MNIQTKIKHTPFRILLSSIILLLLFSCSKNSDKNTKTENVPVDTTGVSDFKETNEDLLTVDYNYFYNELSGSGEWIEVSAKDMGIDIKPGTSLNQGDGSIFSDLLGVKTAYAQTDAELFNLFVWRPSVELASKMMNENEKETPAYVPYNNGQWIYTDAGWYFKANTPQEDLTSHYGRWTLDPNLGWVWLPGKVWSPAWVEMRENDDYVAWAPVPPGIYIEKDVITQTIINENRYTIVEKKQFIEPSVYKYRYQYVENKNKIMIKEMIKTDGVMIKNKTVINKGPDVGSIEKSTGKKIEQVKIKRVGKKNEIVSTTDAISVYTPEFKQVKEVKKEPVTKPEKLVSYKDAKKITKEEQDELKQQDKEQKKEDKNLKKEDKEVKKEQKNDEKEVKKEQKNDEKEMKKEEKKDKDNKKEKDNGHEKKNNDDNGTKKEKQDKGKK
jgi:uncharacterized protein DUF6600